MNVPWIAVSEPPSRTSTIGLMVITWSDVPVTVEHIAKNGWHEFTCPQVPGFHLICEDADLERAYAEVPDAIAEIIESDEGTGGSV